MHYLIDGHNLIAQIEDISLSDADDEAQLILRLRVWVAASPKRRVTVYFDGGLPGGEARNLSGPRLRVFFASAGSDADTLLIKQIRKVKNPPEYTLVSNDREIRAVAERRQMPQMGSDQFAAEMAAEARQRSEPPPAQTGGDEPLLDEAEVAEWLELFGPEPEVPPAPRRRRGRRASRRGKRSDEESGPGAGRAEAPEPVRSADELKESGAPLTEAEVAAWLAAFGPDAEPGSQKGEAEAEPDAEDVRARQLKEIRRRRKERRQPPRPADKMKESGARLSRDEVEEWLDIFRGAEDED